MSLGKGAGVSFSRKHKLNVRSSTDAEVVGMHVAHKLYFITALGYNVNKKQRTKHLKVRFKNANFEGEGKQEWPDGELYEGYWAMPSKLNWSFDCGRDLLWLTSKMDGVWEGKGTCQFAETMENAKGDRC